MYYKETALLNLKITYFLHELDWNNAATAERIKS